MLRLGSAIAPLHLVAGLLALVIATSASAFALRLEQTTPGGANPAGGTGSLISFDLIVVKNRDDPYVTALSTGVSFDPTIIAYRSELSVVSDYYPLYFYPSCRGCDGTWHEPVANPPALWLNPPLGRQQVNVATETIDKTPGLHTRGWFTGEELLATLVFEQVGPGSWTEGFRFDLDHDGNQVIQWQYDGSTWRQVDVADAVSTSLVLSPEPSTLLMLSLGLVLIGVSVRR